MWAAVEEDSRAHTGWLFLRSCEQMSVQLGENINDRLKKKVPPESMLVRQWFSQATFRTIGYALHLFPAISYQGLLSANQSKVVLCWPEGWHAMCTEASSPACVGLHPLFLGSFLLEHLKKLLGLASLSENDHTLWWHRNPIPLQSAVPATEAARTVCMHSQHAHTGSVNPQCGLRWSASPSACNSKTNKPNQANNSCKDQVRALDCQQGLGWVELKD